MFSRDQLKRAASLTEEDFVQLGKCRRPHNRLGFAYQVAFVRFEEPKLRVCSGGDLNPFSWFCFPLLSKVFPGNFH